MWTKAQHVPKEKADKILERWDQTEPQLQRMIVLQAFLDKEMLQMAIKELIESTKDESWNHTHRLAETIRRAQGLL